MHTGIVGPLVSGRHSCLPTRPSAFHARYIPSYIPCRSCSQRSILPRPWKSRHFPKYATSSETSPLVSLYFCHTPPTCTPSVQYRQRPGKEWRTYTRLNNPLMQSSRAFSMVIQRFSSTSRRSQRSRAASYAVISPVRIATINDEKSSFRTGNLSRSILDGRWPRRMRKGIKQVKIRLQM